MNNGYSKYISYVLLIFDLLMLNFASVIGFVIFVDKDFPDKNYQLIFLILNISWVAISSLNNYYDINRLERLQKQIVKQVKVFSIYFITIGSVIFLMKGFSYSRLFVINTSIMFLVLSIAFKLIYYKLLNLYREQGYNYRRVIVLGSEYPAKSIISFIEGNKDVGYKLIGVYNPLDQESLKAFKSFVIEHTIDEVYYASPLTNRDSLREISEFCFDHVIRLKIVPDFRGIFEKRVEIDFYGSVPVLSILTEPLESLSNRFMKRTFDIVFSLVFLTTFFPIIFILVGVLIRLESPGPIFFIQKRTGRKNEDFFCLKFRTMGVNKSANSTQATKDDKRITKTGSFLRKTNIDELPQFINVLKGDMSIVGPRPHMLAHTEEYSKIIKNYMVRHYVKPGITGLAQVKGFRGETKNSNLMKRRVHLDVRYIENWSLWLDFKIIFLTVYNMLKGEKNAY